MIAAAEKPGRNSSWPHYRRALPYFLKVKELLDGGSVGQPLTAEVRPFRPERPEDRDPARLPWRLRREVGGEGYFHDLAPHTLDILDFLLGGDRRRPGLQKQPRRILRRGRHRHGGVPLSLGRRRDRRGVSSLAPGRRGFGRHHGPQGHHTLQHLHVQPHRTDDGRGGTERFRIDPPEHIQGPLIETIVRSCAARRVPSREPPRRDPRSWMR